MFSVIIKFEKQNIATLHLTNFKRKTNNKVKMRRRDGKAAPAGKVPQQNERVLQSATRKLPLIAKEDINTQMQSQYGFRASGSQRGSSSGPIGSASYVE